MNAQPRPTSIDDVDKQVERLFASKEKWVALSPLGRAALMRRAMQTTLAVADRWVNTACALKQFPLGSVGQGEEYLSGPMSTIRQLRGYAEALEAGGAPKLPNTRVTSSGQWVAEVYPISGPDKVVLAGVTGEVWIEPGKLPTQGRIYRDKAAGGKSAGGVSVVLGAGNQTSIGPMDVLYKLVVDDEVCILKMNPVNELIGPVLEEAMKPLIDAGFLEICYGGVDIGAHLTDHSKVDSIHITGSAAAHDAIVWGPGDEGKQRKAEGTPRLKKAITSELGAASPVLIVPGQWSKEELRYQARQVASMLVNNSGFNCATGRLVTTASGWAQKNEFLQLVKETLASIPTRSAYYPSAQRSWETFMTHYPDATQIGRAKEGQLPWTVIEGVTPNPGEFALGNEPWCSVFSFVELEAKTAAEFLDKAVPYVNDQCWGTLSMNITIHPKSEQELGVKFEQAIADIRYGAIAVNCWNGVVYALSGMTWGAFPGHTADDIQSGSGVVHNSLLLDHPQKSVVRAPFVMKPTPVWFADHKNNLEVGKKLTAFEADPGWLKLPGLAMAALKG